jgi:hypothetical protein
MFKSAREQTADLYERLVADRITACDNVLTFNYDLALERELQKARLWEINDGYGFSLGIDGTPPSRVKVLKLHGSVNWWGSLFQGRKGFFQVAGNVFGDRPIRLDSNDFEYLGCSGVRDPESVQVGRGGAIPAIVMPTRRKQFFEPTSLEPFWRELWEQAEEVLRERQGTW